MTQKITARTATDTCTRPFFPSTEGVGLENPARSKLLKNEGLHKSGLIGIRGRTMGGKNHKGRKRGGTPNDRAVSQREGL